MEQHLPELISDLAIILMAAGATTILFKKLRQPVVLGYIIAGFLVGPHFTLFPTIVDPNGIKVWSEIGVIFLLFALGLEFSFKKLVRVGGAASITAVVEIVAMVLIGYVTGRVFGWSQMDSIFLGGILAISSTTIIIRAFEELGVKGRRFAGLVFGALIVEDLVAILLLVLLTTLAISKQFAGVEMAASVVKLLFFLTLWFLSGIFLVPTALRKLRPYLGEETLLVVSLGSCFLMVVLATKAGFSPALGAFIMGSVFAETTDAERIEHLIKPVKDLFGAVFFVSVGTLIDPNVLVEYAVPVLVLTLVTIFGKAISTALGALLAGQSLRHSVQAGLSLSQIGEFSFIIAGLGLTLKVTSDFLYPVAVGVSAVTTFTTPYLIKSADRAVDVVERTLPVRWKEALRAYSAATQSVSSSSTWQLLIKAYAIRVFSNAVVVAAIFLLVAKVVRPSIIELLGSDDLGNFAALVLALTVASPFLWAWVLGQPAKEQARALWSERRYRAPFLALEAARIGSAIGLFLFLAPQFVLLRYAFLFVAVWMVLVLVVFSRSWSRIYARIERRFVANLGEREQVAAAKQGPPMAPWDAHIAKLTVAPESEAVGKSLADSKIRESFGVTVAMIERGKKAITAPSRMEALYPHDVLSVIGTDEQIVRFRDYIEPETPTTSLAAAGDYALQSHFVKESSPFASRTIRDSGLRESAKGLVVGIERSGQRILNPDSTMVIEPGDTLWLVADKALVRALNAKS